MGAGAVGSYYGARLAQAGHSVVFVGRGAHLAAMRDRGLELRAGDQATLNSPVEAVDRPERSASPIDLVLLTVKGYDTAAAIDALRPVVESHTVVLPLLNGVDAPDQLAEAFGAERVLAG